MKFKAVVVVLLFVIAAFVAFDAIGNSRARNAQSRKEQAAQIEKDLASANTVLSICADPQQRKEIDLTDSFCKETEQAASIYKAKLEELR